MKLAWITSAALTMGVSAAIPSVAHADNWRDHRDVNVRVVEHGRYDRDARYDHGAWYDRFRERDFDTDISMREVPRNVLDTLRDFTHGGRITAVQYVHRDGKFFYRFQVDGRREDQSVRIGVNGHILSVEEVAQCDAGWHHR